LALKKARLRVRNEKVQVKFVQDDIFQTGLSEHFDFVWDRGCFHCTEPSKRSLYVRQIKKVIRPGGYLFLKCFSSREPGTRGPFRFSPNEIRELFSPYFRIHSIEQTVYHGTRKPLPRALFCVLQKKSH
jgi:SAM-dependent methyltransferase